MIEKKARFLIVIKSPQGEEQRFLEGDEFIVGRSSDVHVCIPDPLISRAHFKMFVRSGGLWIADLGSTNGTYVNGRSLDQGHDHALQNHDLITIGKSEHRVEIRDLEISKAVIPISTETLVLETATMASVAVVEVPTPASMPAVVRESQPPPLEKKWAEGILQDATTRAQKLIETAQLKAAEIVSLAHQRAEEVVQTVYGKADSYRQKTKEEADKLARAAEHKAEEIIAHSQNLAQGILDDSRGKSHEMRSQARQDTEKMIDDAESFAENLRAQSQKEIEETRQRNLQLMQKEFEDEKKMILNELVENARLDRDRMVKETEDRIEKFKKDSQSRLIEFEDQIAQKTKQLADLDSLFADREKLKIEELNKAYFDQNQMLDQDLSQKKNLFEVSCEKMKLQIDELQSQIQQYEDQYQDKKSSLDYLENEIDQLNAEKQSCAQNVQVLNRELSLIKTQLEIATQDNLRLNNEHSQKLAGLEKNFLQKKNDFEIEFRKYKESEEKRLNEWTQRESGLIKKMKEDSLHLVVELEESLTKELSLASEKVFAGVIPTDHFRALVPNLEKSFKLAIQNRVLKLLHGQAETEANSNSKMKPMKANPKAWKPLSVGMALSAVLFGFLPWIYQRAKNDNPVQNQIETQADLRKQDLERRRFNPKKTLDLRANFVDSVLYTENFSDNYRIDTFRSGLVREGSVYLFKNWKIEEEKAIQTYSLFVSLVETLTERRDKIHPDFVKNDIEKMSALEKETLKKVQDLLGTEVRVEAALKFQARYYQQFAARRGLAGEAATK